MSVENIKNKDGFINNGLYDIVVPDSNLALDVAGALKENGTEIIIYQRHGGLNQRFEITHLGKGIYKIINVNSKKALEIQNSSRVPGARIQVWSYNADLNTMKWRIISLGCGQYKFINVNSGLALAIANGYKTNFSSICAKEDIDDQSQKFILEPRDYNILTDNIYEISIDNSNLVMDITDASTENGAQLIAYPRNNSLSQRFKITHIKDRIYNVININSNKAVEIQNSSRAPGARVQTWSYNSCSNTMKWKIIDAGYDQYKFINVNSELVLDLDGGRKEKANRICAYNDYDNQNQRFILESPRHNFNNVDLKHWMKEIFIHSPNKDIRELVMPSTHNSGIFSGYYTIGVRRQNKNIMGQLCCGVRALDLNFTKVGYTYRTHLDGIYSSVKDEILEHITNQIKNFLNSPNCENEIIIINLMSGDKSNIQGAAKFKDVKTEFINKLKSYILPYNKHYLKKGSMKIKDLVNNKKRVIITLPSSERGNEELDQYFWLQDKIIYATEQRFQNTWFDKDSGNITALLNNMRSFLQSRSPIPDRFMKSCWNLASMNIISSASASCSAMKDFFDKNIALSQKSSLVSVELINEDTARKIISLNKK